jgi:Rrf2 family protein
MLLTRKACYALIIVNHLANNMHADTFSANDLAEIYGFPHEALAKILQHLARAGLLVSHHGVNGGYMLARDPHQITVLDVIQASQAMTRIAPRGKHWRHLQSLPSYDQLRTVSQVVEDALRRVTVADMGSAATVLSRVG